MRGGMRGSSASSRVYRACGHGAAAIFIALVGGGLAGCSSGNKGPVPGGPPLALAATSLPAVTSGANYSAAISASGGTSPYQWSISAGTLPAGLTLGPTGVISGTPTASGTSSFTVQVTDSSKPPQTATGNQSITVSPSAAQLAISTSSLPGGTKGAAYSATLQATGGVTPYSWAISSGSLPGGLQLSATSGAISGTPTATGTFSFTAKVTDSSSPQQSSSKPLSITVSATPTAPTITTTSLPGGTEGTAYSGTMQATGGVTPYSWAISSGSLPGGLQLSATIGAISGTPTATGTFSFTAKVTDSSSPPQSSSKPLSITVTAPTITTTSLPGRTEGPT